MKYYYIQYTITNSVTKKVHHTDCVSDQHPLKWLNFFKYFQSGTWEIKDWKEISQSEYEIGKKTIGIG